MAINYLETQQNLAGTRLLTKIQGVRLEGGLDRDWFPIRPCICVKEEDCPCDTLDDTIVWLPHGTPSEDTGKKWEGNPVLSYRVPVDSQILVETQIPITLGKLQHMKDLSDRGSGKAVEWLQKSKKKGKKPTVGALLIGAFELGWHIGEKIDRSTRTKVPRVSQPFI
jgi:hypothetical protein